MLQILKPIVTLQQSNIKKALNFGLKLAQYINSEPVNLKKIEKLAKREIPIIRVKNKDELSKILGINTESFNAYALPEYSDDFKLKKITIFISNEFNVQKIGSIVHEFTHCIQKNNDNTYMGLKEFSNGNLIQARALNNISAQIFYKLESIKQGEYFNKAQEYINRGDDEKDALIKAFGFENEKEFKRYIKRTFLDAYKETMQDINENQPEIITKYIPLSNDPRKLKQMLKMQCAGRAGMEKEAYEAQKQIVTILDKKSLSAENEINPIFNKFLEEILSDM